MTTIGKEQSVENQIYWVVDNVIANDFPPANHTLRDPDGLLAIGGDLSSGRLLNAYERGIFPWYSEGQPILWWSPNPRCVLELDSLKISKSLRKKIRHNLYQVTFNKAFHQVIKGCSEARNGIRDTWITQEMSDAYLALHKLGHAISVECWDAENILVGGLYGVVIGKVFFGESMFSRMPDASKVALVHLVRELKQKQFRIIDCQIYSNHLRSLGATPVPRDLFLNILKHYTFPVLKHRWPEKSDNATVLS